MSGSRERIRPADSRSERGRARTAGQAKEACRLHSSCAAAAAVGTATGRRTDSVRRKRARGTLHHLRVYERKPPGSRATCAGRRTHTAAAATAPVRLHTACEDGVVAARETSRRAQRASGGEGVRRCVLGVKRAAARGRAAVESDRSGLCERVAGSCLSERVAGSGSGLRERVGAGRCTCTAFRRELRERVAAVHQGLGRRGGAAKVRAESHRDDRRVAWERGGLEVLSWRLRIAE